MADEKVFEKVSDTEFKSTETKQEVKTYNLTDLKNDRNIYLNEIAAYQAKIDAVDLLIAQAEALGVVKQEILNG